MKFFLFTLFTILYINPGHAQNTDNSQKAWIIKQQSLGKINTHSPVKIALSFLQKEFEVSLINDNSTISLPYYQLKKDNKLMFNINCFSDANQDTISTIEVFSPIFKMENGFSVGKKLGELIKLFSISEINFSVPQIDCDRKKLDVYIFVEGFHGVFVLKSKTIFCKDSKKIPKHLTIDSIIIY
jgi:hypothetical protein